jgi:hypothetical protein
MSQEEFIILMAVRINRASPKLIARIYSRFQELDRKKLGTIDLHDLLDSKHVSNRHRFSVNKYNQTIITSDVHLPSRLCNIEDINATDGFQNYVDNIPDNIKDTTLEDSSISDDSADVEAVGTEIDDSHNNIELTMIVEDESGADSSEHTGDSVHGSVDDTIDIDNIDNIDIEKEDFEESNGDKSEHNGHDNAADRGHNNKKDQVTHDNAPIIECGHISQDAGDDNSTDRNASGDAKADDDEDVDYEADNNEDNGDVDADDDEDNGDVGVVDEDNNDDNGGNNEDNEDDSSTAHDQESLTKQNLQKLLLSQQESAAHGRKLHKKQLTIDTNIDIDQDDTSLVSDSPYKHNIMSPDVLPATAVGHSQRPSVVKKSVFSIMETMQTEYVVHGNQTDNVYSPLKATSALMSSSKRSFFSAGPSPILLGGLSQRRSVGSIGTAPTPTSAASPSVRRGTSLRGSLGNARKGSFFSIRSVRSAGSKGSGDSPLTGYNAQQQAPPIRKSKSMETPQQRKEGAPRVDHLLPRVMSAEHVGGVDVDTSMERRRASLESSNTQLTKFYKSESNFFSKQKKSPPKRRQSLGNPADMLDLIATKSLEKEKALMHLTEMNNSFKRRKSSILSMAQLPSMRKLFRNVSSFDESVSTFHDKDSDIDSEDPAADESQAKTIISLFGMQVVEMKTETYYFLLSILKMPVLRIFSLWVTWIFIGGVFFALYQRENTSFSCGLYISVSVGIGMFWMHGTTCHIDSNPGIKAFSIGKHWIIICMMCCTSCLVCISM